MRYPTENCVHGDWQEWKPTSQPGRVDYHKNFNVTFNLMHLEDDSYILYIRHNEDLYHKHVPDAETGKQLCEEIYNRLDLSAFTLDNDFINNFDKFKIKGVKEYLDTQSK